ncbi:hypothetical protein Q4595_21130, partial [Wenyingzhuangia sp. 1_MG-2023]|nr:hypothetical protein [Wenyingzhuangia sp. 1_MG-2023]
AYIMYIHYVLPEFNQLYADGWLQITTPTATPHDKNLRYRPLRSTACNDLQRPAMAWQLDCSQATHPSPNPCRQ